MERGTSFVESRPTATFLPKSFGRRSEVLRDGIIGLMLLGGKAREKAFADPDKILQTCLSLHPLHFFILNNPSDPIAAIEDRTLQNLGSDMMFRALALPRFQDENADRETIAFETVTEYLRELRTELHDKDGRIDLGKAIEAARKSGNKEEEKQLFESFARLTRGDASQNG